MLATQKGRSNPVLISLSRWEKDKTSPRLEFQPAGQSLLHQLLAQPGNAHHLVSAGFAAGYGNGGTGNFKQLRKEFDHRLVGPAFHRWGGERKLERATHNPGDRVLTGARVDFHGER